MTPEEARAEFDRIAERLRAEGNPDSADTAEFLREYLLNDEFRKKLHQLVWELTKGDLKNI